MAYVLPVILSLLAVISMISHLLNQEYTFSELDLSVILSALACILINQID